MNMTTDGTHSTIVVLGGINMNLIGTAPRLPTPGETLLGDKFYTAPGGKGANQAVAAARLGADVKMVGRVGTDVFGRRLLGRLRDHGIDVTAVAEDPGNASGIAMIILDSNRQNHIVAIYGSNMECNDTQLMAAKSALEGADVLLLQLEIPHHVSLGAAQAARERGVQVIWDPAPASFLSKKAYAAMDIITPNQTEARSLTGITVNDAASARAAAKTLLEWGVPIVVVKLGEMGTFYSSHAGNGFVPPFQVEALDTVGAGDAFGGALSVALAEGAGLEDAVRYGAAAGALAVTKPGAQDSMPTRQEVEAFLVSA